MDNVLLAFVRSRVVLTLMGCADLLGDFSSDNEPTTHLPRGK